MVNKLGILELLLASALYVTIWFAGHTLTDALSLIFGLHALFVVAALLVNTVGLAPYLRQAAWRVVLMPYSSLALNVPLAIMTPGIEHLQRQCGSTSSDANGSGKR
jgi:hypothetical protein